jgi:hypothetical protein
LHHQQSIYVNGFIVFKKIAVGEGSSMQFSKNNIWKNYGMGGNPRKLISLL